MPKNETDPVPRYEFESAHREMLDVKQNSENVHKEFKEDIRDINNRLEKNYYTKDGVRDQFKIELSDYKMMKALLATLGTLVLGLIFTVVQQYITNQGVGK